MGLKKLEKRPIVKRPRSLIILVMVQILQALALLGIGAYTARQFGWGWEGGELVFSPLMPYSVIGIADSGLLYLVLTLFTLFIALELWLVRRWAWLAAMILQGFSLLAALLGYLREQPNYISMVLGIVLVLYLNQAEVQAVFHRTSRSA